MFAFMIPGSVGDYYYYDNDDEKDTLLCLDVERDYYSFSFVALTVDQKRYYIRESSRHQWLSLLRS